MHLDQAEKSIYSLTAIVLYGQHGKLAAMKGALHDRSISIGARVELGVENELMLESACLEQAETSVGEFDTGSGKSSCALKDLIHDRHNWTGGTECVIG